jgi:hypothetical protein
MCVLYINLVQVLSMCDINKDIVATKIVGMRDMGNILHTTYSALLGACSPAWANPCQTFRGGKKVLTRHREYRFAK